MNRPNAAVIVIHGLWMHGFFLQPLRARLARRTGWHAETFSYRSMTRALPENARRLKRRLDELQVDTVHLVGHSLGGVLALQMLNLFPSERIGRIVCLGSPLVDSKAARRLSRWGPTRSLLGPTLHEGVLEQPLGSVHGEREVGVIAGSVGVGLGMIVGRLEKPHDGVVSVTETELPGITAHTVMQLNHWGLLYSGKVADEVAQFLQHGTFAEPGGRF